MKVIRGIVIFNADDENPDCMQCDRVDMCSGGVFINPYGIVVKDNNFKCGAEWGWRDYQRTESLRSITNRLNRTREKKDD